MLCVRYASQTRRPQCWRCCIGAFAQPSAQETCSHAAYRLRSGAGARRAGREAHCEPRAVVAVRIASLSLVHVQSVHCLFDNFCCTPLCYSVLVARVFAYRVIYYAVCSGERKTAHTDSSLKRERDELRRALGEYKDEEETDHDPDEQCATIENVCASVSLTFLFVFSATGFVGNVKRAWRRTVEFFRKHFPLSANVQSARICLRGVVMCRRGLFTLSAA